MDMNHQKVLFTVILIACRALCPMAHAVIPAPDGGYPGENTAEELQPFYISMAALTILPLVGLHSASM